MIYKRLHSLLSAQNFKAQTLVIAVLMALSALFFYNPFSGIELTEWDRSFCEASLAGIDPLKRISSFYRLYFLFPCLCGLFALIVSVLLKNRNVPYFGLSAAISFCMVLASYSLRYGSVSSYTVALALAVSCFLWQWILVFWVRCKGKNDEERVERECNRLWTKVQRNLPRIRLAFIYGTLGISLLCSLPMPCSLKGDLLLSGLQVGTVILAGLLFVYFIAHGGVKDLADSKLNKLSSVGIFVLVSSLVLAYSKLVLPVLARHSIFFEEHIESFGPLLFGSSMTVLMSLSFLYVLVVAREESCDVYRDFVAALFLPISLSLLLPLPIVLSGVLSFLLLLILFRRRHDIAGYYGILTWLPLLFCFLCEFFFTLFEKGVVSFSPRYGVYAVLVLVLAIICLKKKFFCNFKILLVSEKWFYVGALLSFAILAYGNIAYFHEFRNIQVDFMDFYEHGNLLGIIDTVNRGRLPVIDYFSAHALSDVFTGILHGFIHGNVAGALSDPYRDFILFSCGGVTLFFILSRFFNAFFAFALICFFPLNTNGFHFVDLCLLGVLLHFWLHRKESVAAMHFYWFCIALLAFYRYDTGVAFGIASISCSLILFISRRDRFDLVKFLLSGVSISIALLLFYFVYCEFNGIVAVDRIKEWISLTLHSNSYWAEEILANSLVSPMFIVAYFLIPLAEAFIVFYLIVESLVKKRLEKTAALALVFSIAGLFLLTRAYVFYTLSFTLGRGSVLFCYSVFALSFFVLHLLHQKRVACGYAAALWLVAVSSGIWFCNGANHFLPDGTNLLFNRAVSNLKDVRESLLWNQDEGEGSQERFRMDDTLSYYSSEFKSVFSKILNEHETFLDFADVPAVYALAEREKPFYTAQSPGLLSDLYSQEMFLREIESREVPVAITAWSDRGHMQVIAKVKHQVRFYKIAEYLYTHYKPLVRVSDFVIWCRPERYDEYVQRLRGSFWKLADYGYEPNSEYHYYDLKWNPYIWANLDKFNAAGNAVLDEAQGTDDGRLQFRGSQMYPVSLGNYVAVEIESPEEFARARILFSESGGEQSQYGYAFDLKKGLQKYLIRSSQDYNWFAYNINTVQLECGACTIRRVQILQGD